MYETHFGLSGPPFQLNPDPAFYFDSRGHSNALAYLKFGVYQGEGFIVVTGDIGAGKTTLVRTLLEGINPEQVVAAQVVSTQLESGDLLRAIIAAFGISSLGASKAHSIATLEAFLTASAAKGRRVLLVVDEAQNLRPEAVEELRMLSNFQLGKHALLQSFLVGQPELRTMLESKSMEQFRQRVIASCHLGPLDQAETRAYVEHRLRCVGWTHTPRFEPEAFDQIHHWTMGIPRRINLLCNRLLLATYLASGETIEACEVERTAREFRGEVGEAAALTPSIARGPDDAGRAGVVRRVHGELAGLKAPLLCVVDTPSAYMEAAALASELAQHSELPQLVCVNPGLESAVALEPELGAVLRRPALDVHLSVAPGHYAKHAAAVQLRFDSIVEELAPRAVLVFGNSDAALACGLVAAKAEVPLLRLESGVRKDPCDASQEMNGMLLDRLAEVLYVGKLMNQRTLYRQGIGADRIHSVGSLLGNVLRLVLPGVDSARDTLVRFGAPLMQDQGYAMVSLQVAALGASRDDVATLVSTLCLLHSELPLVWPVQKEALVTLKAMRLESRLHEANVILLPPLSYLQTLGLLKDARCVIVGSDAALHAEAQLLAVPSLCLMSPGCVAASAEEGRETMVVRGADQALRAIKDILRDAKDPGDDHEKDWDGGAATRIASHLRGWLGHGVHGRPTKAGAVAAPASAAPRREAIER